tara:strand:+ start:5214 stop:5372 length:159 start_codon:yes stop_codon:yes gene_type:complete
MTLPTFHELLSLGIKTYGYGDADSESTDGIYGLNGESYVLTGTTVIKQSDVD